MSARIPHPCSKHGCSETTTSRFCPAHTKSEAAKFDKQRRDDPVRKFYNSRRWHWTRLNILSQNPICSDCKHWASEDVHHKIDAHDWIAQHDGDTNQFFNEENLIALCHRCHSALTSKEVGWAGNNAR